MKLTREKEFLIYNLGESNINNFKEDIKTIACEDFNDFIDDFMNDMKLLFSECNQKRFQKILDEYDPDENMFDE